MSIYIYNILIMLSINVILAITLNLIVGFAGIFSLAHAIFYGIGAYVAANLALVGMTDLFIILPVAFMIGALAGLTLALPTLRVRGLYFIATSLGVQLFGLTVFSEWKLVTGGLGGIVGVPALTVGGYPLAGYFRVAVMSIILTILVYSLVVIITTSSYGRSLRALRDDEVAASSLGKSTSALKITSVMLSSGLATVAGVIYISYVGFVNTETFGLDTSIMILVMIIVGGVHSIYGPLIGAALITLLPSLLTFIPGLPAQDIGAIRVGIYGIILVVLMIIEPGGLSVILNKYRLKDSSNECL